MEMISVLKGIMSRSLRYIAASPDGTDNDEGPRFGLRNELYVASLFSGDDTLFADEGSYFVAGSAVVAGSPGNTVQPGTGLATIATLTSFTDLSPFILMQNANSVNSQLRQYLKYLKLIVTAAGTAGASIRFAYKIDQQNAQRYTSGGSKLVPFGVNGDEAEVSNANIYAGALVATAASPAARGPMGNALLRPVIPVVGDTYLMTFGDVDAPVGSLAPAGTAIADRIVRCPPAVIGPQEWFAGHIWLPSQSAASSYEVEIGYVER
jgi:hypothetical protein